MQFLESHMGQFRSLSSIEMPRIFPAIGALLIIGMLCTGLFLAFVPWVQTAQGAGVITALDPNDRPQALNALVSGRIQEWSVHDGAQVKAGDPIVRIVDNDPRLLERLGSERGQIEAKLNAIIATLRTAEIDLARMSGLYDKGLVARRDLEQTQIRVEELRAAIAETRGERARVDVNRSRLSAQTIRAPRDGVILRVNGGDTSTYVTAGDVLATFLPDSVNRAVELRIDGRDGGLVRVGAPVRLQFEGWPTVQFSGWPSVAIGTFGGTVSAVDPSADESGRVRVLVTEDPSISGGWPPADAVRLGSIARGWVILEQVTVGYELWRQLNNFPPEISPKARSAAAGA